MNAQVERLMESIEIACQQRANAAVSCERGAIHNAELWEQRANATMADLRTLLESLGGWRAIDDDAKARSVLIAYRNPLGKWRRVRAKFLAVGTLELSEDDPRYDHDAEENFAPGGWYELCENAEIINMVDGTPELWCELPPLPTPPIEG